MYYKKPIKQFNRKKAQTDKRVKWTGTSQVCRVPVPLVPALFLWPWSYVLYSREAAGMDSMDSQNSLKLLLLAFLISEL